MQMDLGRLASRAYRPALVLVLLCVVQHATPQVVNTVSPPVDDEDAGVGSGAESILWAVSYHPGQRHALAQQVMLALESILGIESYIVTIEDISTASSLAGEQKLTVLVLDREKRLAMSAANLTKVIVERAADFHMELSTLGVAAISQSSDLDSSTRINSSSQARLGISASRSPDGSITFFAQVTPENIAVSSIAWSPPGGGGAALSNKSVIFTSVNERVSVLTFVRPDTSDTAVRVSAVLASGQVFTSSVPGQSVGDSQTAAPTLVQLSIDPPNVILQPGETASFTCNVNPPSQSTEIEWSPKPSGQYHLAMGGRMLVISDVQVTDTGVYVCSGNFEGQPIITSARLTVRSSGPPGPAGPPGASYSFDVTWQLDEAATQRLVSLQFEYRSRASTGQWSSWRVDGSPASVSSNGTRRITVPQPGTFQYRITGQTANGSSSTVSLGEATVQAASLYTSPSYPVSGRWTTPSALVSRILYYIMEYRIVISGTFGSFTRLSHSIPVSASAYNITVPAPGTYNYQILGQFDGSQQSVDTGFFTVRVEPAVTNTPYRALIEWQSSGAPGLEYYSIEYRQSFGAGQYGAWTYGAQNVLPDRGSALIYFPMAGAYEYRLIGHFPGYAALLATSLTQVGIPSGSIDFPYSVDISWPQPLETIRPLLQFYIIQYREDLGGGEYGGWQTASNNVPATATMYTLRLPRVGFYQYRVVGQLARGPQALATGMVTVRMSEASTSPQQPTTEVITSDSAAPTTAAPQPVPVTLRWLQPPATALQSVEHLTVDYRTALPSGQFGEWQVGVNHLRPTTTETQITLLSPGMHEFRILANVFSQQVQIGAGDLGLPLPSSPMTIGIFPHTFMWRISGAPFQFYRIRYRREGTQAWSIASDSIRPDTSMMSFMLPVGTYDYELYGVFSGEAVSLEDSGKFTVTEANTLPPQLTEATSTPVLVTTQPPLPPLIGPGGKFENELMSAQWAVDFDNQKVRFILRGQAGRYVAVGLSEDEYMVRSDILVAVMNSTGAFVTDQFALTRNTPFLDIDGSQLSEIAARQNGADVEFAFSIPCDSQDVLDDVSALRTQYLLFATGATLNGGIGYHATNRWIQRTQLAEYCRGETSTTVVPASAVDTTTSTIPGPAVITSSPGNSNTSGSFEAEAIAGTVSPFTARWKVDQGSQSVTINLHSPLFAAATQYVAFGISSDRRMAGSDIITGHVDGGGRVVVADRYARSYVLPEQDEHSQVSSVMGTHDVDGTNITFTIPCWSEDPKDVAVAGSHFFLFSRGPVDDGGQIGFHGVENKWFTRELVHIDCGVRPSPSTAPPTVAPTGQ
eukprot:scpid22078/ scgid3075/ 